MHRYLIHQPGLALFIIWADTEPAALATARDWTGLTAEQSPRMAAAMLHFEP